MDTFSFPYHSVTDVFPESSTRVRFGKGYTFASKPRGPDQVVFRLFFNGMQWIFSSWGVPTTGSDSLNIQTLISFYESHGLYEKFLYVHPRRGTVTVRFKNPFETPKSLPNGKGITEPFEIQLELQP